MEVRVEPSTIKFAVALIDPDCTVIVTAPADSPVAVPDPLIMAILGSEEVQVAFPFTECWLPSEYVPIAL